MVPRTRLTVIGMFSDRVVRFGAWACAAWPLWLVRKTGTDRPGGGWGAAWGCEWRGGANGGVALAGPPGPVHSSPRAHWPLGYPLRLPRSRHARRARCV